MELKPAYTLTEVGVIPEDWRVCTLGEICTLENGDRSTNYPSPGSFVLSGIPFVNAGHIAEGKIDSGRMNYITPESYNRLGCGKIRAGDILFCLRGSLGKFGLVHDDFGDGAIASSLVIVRPKDAEVTPEFLVHYFGSPLCALMIEKWSGGAAQPNLGAQDLARFSIPLPPTHAEQHAIAAALSQADTLLDGLELLLAKKRDLKRAATQQLLTGRTRLPGFHGKWTAKRLSSVMRFQMGFPFSSAFFNENTQGVRVVRNRDLKSDDQVIHYLGDYEPPFLVSNGDVLVGMDGDFLPCRWSKGSALLNQRVGRIVPLATLNPLFAYYFLFEPLKEIEATTSSTTVKHLSQSDIENIEKPLPQIDEQAAIAGVLSDMDAEVSALETRRDKTHALKQAMMQELITGKTRLVPTECSHA